MIRAVSIVTSLLLVAGAYLYVSIREKTYLNVLTPMFVIMIPAEYLLELYHLWAFGATSSPFAYAMSYSSYAVYTVAFALAYAHARMPCLRLPFEGYAVRRSKLPAYVLLFCGILLYLPVLIKFRHEITDPREIYTQTRVGYGQYFVLSIMLLYLAFILLLFARGVRKLEFALFLIVALTFSWLQGSKGHMLGLFFILALYAVYIKNYRVGFLKFSMLAIATGAVGILLFLITTPSLLLHHGLTNLSEYSDYTHNGMLVIDSGIGPLYGKLTLEDQLYPRIPRALDPGKPHDYGDFYLAKHFFPDTYARQVGAPAFGDGLWFADFHVFAVPILMILGLLGGAMLKMFSESVQKFRTPGSFILMLFGAGIPLVPISGTFLLPESIVLAVMGNAMYSMRIWQHSRR